MKQRHVIRTQSRANVSRNARLQLARCGEVVLEQG